MRTSIAITIPSALLVLCLGLAPVTAQIVAEHPGACPFVDYTVIKCQMPPPEPRCSFDSECKPDQKCCNTGCDVMCVKSDPVHAGVCPFVDRTLIKCRMPPPFPNCTSDTQCQADEKCCDAGCQVTCVKSETEHPGACPFVDYTLIKCQMPPPTPRCSFDSECPPDQKCCNTGCDIKCVKSDPVHAGVCPFVDRTLIKCRMLPPFPKCTSDTQCQADEKCCDTGCQVTCVKSETEHPGACPFVDYTVIKCQMPPPTPKCSFDSECKPDQKCCNTGCDIKCVKSDPVHAGVCPFVDRTLIKCRMPPRFRNCTSDTQCQADEKCCDSGCRFTCVKSKTEKAGVCPLPGTICDEEFLERKCSDDGDCPDAQKCCRLSCSIACEEPRDSDYPFPLVNNPAPE